MSKRKLRILHIHVRFEYWDKAWKNQKFWEWREIKSYWDKFLISKEYDLIYYWRGFTGRKRIYRWDGWEHQIITHKEFGNIPKKVYAISLNKPT